MLRKFVVVTLVLSLLSVTCATSFASPPSSAQSLGQTQDLLSLVASEDFQGIEAIGFTVRDLDYDNGVTSFSIDMTPDIVDSFTVCRLSETETQIVVDEVDSSGNTCTDTVLFNDGVLSAIDGVAVDFTNVGYSQASGFSTMGTQALPVWQYYENPPGSTIEGSYNVLYNTYSNTVSTGQQTISNVTVAVLITCLVAGLGGAALPIGIAAILLQPVAVHLKNYTSPYSNTTTFTAKVYRIQGDLEIREKHTVTYYPDNPGTPPYTISFYRWAIG
jgi:hypothetical protein